MQKILDKQTKEVTRGGTGVQADAQFHFSIGQATQNQALQKLASALMDLLGRSREESLQTPGRNEVSLASHRKILSAIEDHDKDKAREAMLHHLEQVEQNVFSSKKARTSEDEKELDQRRIA